MNSASRRNDLVLVIACFACCLMNVLLPMRSHAVEAAPSAFTSVQAKDAEAKYARVVAAATKQYVDDLNLALKSALQAGNLDEANAINACAKEVAAGKLA